MFMLVIESIKCYYSMSAILLSVKSGKKNGSLEIATREIVLLKTLNFFSTQFHQPNARAQQTIQQLYTHQFVRICLPHTNAPFIERTAFSASSY